MSAHSQSITDADVLNNMLASWDSPVTCSHPTKSGRHCRRPGQWWVDFHGCKSGTMCSAHFTAWRAANEAVMAASGDGKCSNCDQCWDASEIYYTAVRL